MKNIFILLLLIVTTNLVAQEELALKKQLNAFRINEAIKVDGSLSETVWSQASPASSFVQIEPDPGTASKYTTTVKVLYDDVAIYIGAALNDPAPNEILKQFSQRDDVGNADWFGFMIDAYQDGLNGVGFYVSAAGVQIDLKYSSDGGGGPAWPAFAGDENWDAVWESKVIIGEKGWNVEMKIPYSAIRFPNIAAQTWNINFGRNVRRDRESSWWNEIKPSINGFLNQTGQLNGIRNIKPPLRLSATPFFSTYFENYFDKNENPKSSWGRSINGGMDIKYGINDAFTLDMTVIPDFGQVQSDNQVLNLSPFEVQFDENRQFFTEGIELFNKGDIFYSRRIGGQPLNAEAVEDQLTEGAEIIQNPNTTQLYNATKVSGRTKKGLGIGVFNAVAGPTNAIIRSKTGEEFEIQTGSLTNYNVLVFDQNLKNNSYVTLINTNVWRNGSDYEANVTGTEFALRNKENTYQIGGEAALSQKYFGTRTDLGHKLEFGLAKTSGNFTWSLEYDEKSDDYDPTDLGFIFRNNTRSIELNTGYNIFKPFWRFNRLNTSQSISYTRLYNPNVFSDFSIFANVFGISRSFFAGGIFTRLEPILTYDYFDPRTEDYSRYYTFPRNFLIGGFVSSDYRKKFAFDLELFFRNWEEQGRYLVGFSFEPRFRANDKLFFLLEINNEIIPNTVGYVGPNESGFGYDLLKEADIVFSRRDQIVFDNVLNIDYIFNDKMGLTFRARHYWTRVKYDSFHLLGFDGYLANTDYTGIDVNNNALHNTSFNIFNIDMVYRWRFAPGSDIFIVWKNAIFREEANIESSYFSNFTNLLDAPQTNSLSLKVIYYLDYLQLKGRKSKTRN